ncbi:FecR family protein [Pseudopedobacter beijingensis]|uniref:FecR family protein n=1 Tax=Pseudopedobacter beijingensis TaxID=1207056 RepID=A0ABW4ICC8_9SPHI
MTDELLIKYLLGETEEKERTIVEDWMRQSDENQQQFNHVKFLWEKSGELLKKETQPDENEAWERFVQRRNSVTEKSSRRLNPAFLKVASLFFVVGIAVWFYLSKLNTTVEITAQDNVLSQTLSDGSVLTVNKHTQLKFKPSSKKRLVELQEGEVFFDVSPNKDKPFIVDLDNGVQILVVGTSFNVKYREGYTEVIVESGLVKVFKANQELQLHPGDKIELGADQQNLAVSKTSDSLYKYYRNKEFVINGVALQKVVEVLSEAYSTKVTLATEDLKTLNLNVTFKEEPLEKILEIIAQTFNLKIIKDKEGYILKKK